MSARIGVTAFALGMFACAPAIAQDAQTSMQSGRSENLSSKLSKSGGAGADTQFDTCDPAVGDGRKQREISY